MHPWKKDQFGLIPSGVMEDTWCYFCVCMICGHLKYIPASNKNITLLLLARRNAVDLAVSCASFEKRKQLGWVRYSSITPENTKYRLILSVSPEMKSIRQQPTEYLVQSIILVYMVDLYCIETNNKKSSSLLSSLLYYFWSLLPCMLRFTT